MSDKSSKSISPRLIPLKDRGVIGVKGIDSVRFLQSLTTQNLEKLTPSKALYSLLLTPQGRVFADFFILQTENTIWLECAKERLPALMCTLQLYCLRQDVTLEDLSDTLYVFSLFGDKTVAGDMDLLPLRGSCRFENAMDKKPNAVFVDPRLSHLGLRFIATPKTSFLLSEWPQGKLDDYRTFCFELGIAEGVNLMPSKAMPLEYGLDKLNAIGDQKGCYVGQEVITRTQHRGIVRKHIFPALFTGPKPDKGSGVTFNGKPVGEVIATHKTLALLRLLIKDTMVACDTKEPMLSGLTSFSPYTVSWMNLSSDLSSTFT